MNNLVFVDSCIVIDYINGKLKLDKDTVEKYCFNSIVDMEVLVGVKNKRDLNTTNKKLNLFKNISIDQEVMDLARNLLEKYVLSHGMSIYDSIVAATCLVYDLPLWTHNKKDFKYIEELQLIE
ncbi:type II toxin-antitoxin system VapC family toxin [Sulfurimonas sp.]|uniref:type II toxin-antitoxin system VapC family toxin n=1 Tax=Sulfurimonas sp. TaxID=2022749 RepID=UPI001A0EAC3C|nr:type II toxin-antitoxin system VapC family toxin [Sulfurimonas sp.]MBE0515415.1 type II toxin-antitoxin system VapC family toxin [Sulfurimonas sp.]